MTNTDLAGMPVADKIQLMESLWESLIADPAGMSVIPHWHNEVLVERGLLLDQGQETLSAWDEAKQRIRNQTNKQ